MILVKWGQLKIHALYDLLSQRFLSLSFSGFNRNDQAAAQDVLPVLQEVLRDLGYLVVESYQRIALAGAFFLTRLRLDSGPFDPQTHRPLSLLKQLRRAGPLGLPSWWASKS